MSEREPAMTEKPRRTGSVSKTVRAAQYWRDHPEELQQYAEQQAAAWAPVVAALGRQQQPSSTGAEVTASQQEKVRENRLRRLAARQGRILVKSRRRDPRADDYGLYVLVDDCAGNRGGLGRTRGGQAATSAFARGEGMPLDRV